MRNIHSYLNSEIVLLLVLCVLSILSPGVNSATDIVFDEERKVYESAENVFFIEDKDGQLTLNQASLLSPERWQRLPSHVANFGFTQSAFWFKFDVSNAADTKLDLYVHVNFSLLDKIDFYAFNAGKVEEQYSTGDVQSFNSRPVKYSTFLLPLSLDPHETKQVLMRVESRGSVQVPISIWEKETFFEEKQTFVFLYGVFLSVILIMGIYNLCLYLMIRDKCYLYYTVFTFCIAGVHSTLDGIAYQWFWPDYPTIHHLSTLTLVSLGCVASVVFTRELLPIPKKGLIRSGVNGLLILSVIALIIGLLMPYRLSAIFITVMAIITMVGVLIICIAMLQYSPRIARFYSIAWSFYFIGISLKGSGKMGLIAYSPVTEYIGNVGAVSGFIILSLALAERLNAERKGKEKAQQEAIGHLQRFEELYENAIEGIFGMDTKGRLKSANPALLMLLGVDSIDEIRSKDRLFKPEDLKRLLKEVKKRRWVTGFEAEIVNKQGQSIWVNLSARFKDYSDFDEVMLEGTLFDVTERRAFDEKLTYLAEHDSLTGFLNRRAFEGILKRKLDSDDIKFNSHCLMYLDLDQFKIVNDLCGHAAGDELLKQLSKRLLGKLDELGKNLIIARLGGDEFAILISDVSIGKARLLAESIRQSIEGFLFVWEGKHYTLGVSIGLVKLSAQQQTVEQVLMMADAACYQAKSLGRNRIHLLMESDKDVDFRKQEMQWVTVIKDALANNRFFLVFQNIGANLKSEGKHHYEILLRMLDASGYECAPYQFIPVAERYDLMPSIDRWVIRHYFKWLHDNPKHLAQLACGSINITPQSMGDSTFQDFIFKAVNEFHIPPNKICFEITEGMAITHIDNTMEFINKFHDLGFRFALDDFGTGFSSYAHLKELNVDYVKIDGVFVKNILQSEVDHAMVKSICEIAKVMKIKTVAEFVENEAIRQKLIEIGIDYSQGYHLHKPEKLAGKG